MRGGGEDDVIPTRVGNTHLISGSFDYLVKARLSGMAKYRQLLGSMLERIPVPAQSNSYVVMEEVKESFVLRLGRRSGKG